MAGVTIGVIAFPSTLTDGEPGASATRLEHVAQSHGSVTWLNYMTQSRASESRCSITWLNPMI
jgi:hypothetical protein